MDRYRFNPTFSTSLKDADGDFSPVRYQYLFDGVLGTH
jgi:hypothetical protein